MTEKTYYLKWDIDNKSFLLDRSFNASDFVYGIRKVLLTEEQANEFAERIELMYRGKEINLTFLEYEFDQFFHICKDCGAVTSRNKWVKRQKTRCYDCYQATIYGVMAENRRKVVEQDRVERMQAYVKTDQGRADIVGLSVIKTNVKVQLKKYHKTQKDLGEALGMTEESANKLLNKNTSMRIEHLYAIAEWLFVPIDLLLKMPRGTLPMKKKNNIPIVVYRKPMKMIK